MNGKRVSQFKNFTSILNLLLLLQFVKLGFSIRVDMKIDYHGFTPATPERVKPSPFTPLKLSPSSSETKKKISSSTDSFHSLPCNRVPNGDSPSVKAKHPQVTHYFINFIL